MGDLSAIVGIQARDVLCRAIDGARRSIRAEVYSIDDPAVVDHLNRAARRGVDVRITLEGDVHRFRGPSIREPTDDCLRAQFEAGVRVTISRSPHALVHAKAVVVDDSTALFSTANFTRSGFAADGDVLVVDRLGSEVSEIRAKIDAATLGARATTPMRSSLEALLASEADLRIASEDLSDPRVVDVLERRAHLGRHDRVLIGSAGSVCARRELRALCAAGVHVRVPAHGYMHEKLVDAGDQVYIGSANLTYDGISRANEVGIIARPLDFDDGLRAVRDQFDAMWRSAQPQAGE
jgi:phosphatidylserine/phosphatidylglycerophosphate/cardiolipin synthase-like enzyme